MGHTIVAPTITIIIVDYLVDKHHTDTALHLKNDTHQAIKK